jgi:hypothetical protein
MRASDFCRFIFKDGSQADFMCFELMIDRWPPPEYLVLAGRNFQRVSYSLLNDKQCPDIARGALYRHMPDTTIGETNGTPNAAPRSD